jgi:hypothetical protein
MCMLVPSNLRGLRICKSCNLGTQSFPCVHCGFKPEAPSDDYRKNYNKTQKTNDKYNL